MSQKRPSGSEFRKRKRVREMEAKKMENTLRKWTVTQQENSQEDVSNDDVLALTGMSGTKSGNNLKIIYKEKEDNPVNPSQQDLTLPITTSPSSEIQIEKAAATDKIQLDINDPVSWLPLTDHIRCFLVEKGPDQGKVSQNISSTEDAGRKFNIHWFTKKMSNGEMVPRSWLIYSKKRDAIFCFPCILFGSSSTKQIMPALADAQKGFNDWRHLSPRIPEHENSTFHRENCIKWKMLEQKIKRKTTIDASLQKAIDQETNKWRHILKVCTNILLFCAENNLPLRGSHERIGESGSGVFLSAVDMISKFDPELRAHIESLHKGNISYFTPYIQNELIDILASEVKKQILDDVRAAKYFSILFDCTPDVSHKEQMSQILRFVKVSEQKVTIEERFIDFIQSHEKTGEGLSKEILEKLEVDGLNIQDLRGQGYDNGSNMAGKYNGVQAKIKQINENADYVPCAAHSLNLSGVHAASVTPDMITFFGLIQKIFVFFSSSTVRWETLMKYLNISLKKHADTRWASKARAVKALNSQIPQIWCVLKIQTTNDYNAETISTAKSIMDQINYKFICTLQIWDKILESVDKVNVALQSKTMTIDKASELIKGLTNQIQNIRETIDIVFEKAKKICEQCGIEDNFPEKRRKRVKRHDLIESSDSGYDITQQQSFKIQINEAIDTIISELKWRFEKLRDIHNSFGFLTLKHITTYSVEELKKYAADLSIKYSADINATEFWSEIETLKSQVEATTLFDNCECQSSMGLLKAIVELDLKEMFPNIVVVLKIFLTMPVTVASCERSFRLRNEKSEESKSLSNLKSLVRAFFRGAVLKARTGCIKG
ncbi:hypothetical protein evm_012739 [Chilo suppressalis]|nr:hypothetical protein evm_012739 [Chilo suppressalis]